MEKMVKEIAYRWDGRRQVFVPSSQHVERFLKGPVPWPWLAAAARLPGQALAVGLALWRLSGATRSMTVKLSTSEVAGLGVSRSAKARALQALATGGLVAIEQLPGSIPRITILDTAR